jgi:hypothetical protein
MAKPDMFAENYYVKWDGAVCKLTEAPVALVTA